MALLEIREDGHGAAVVVSAEGEIDSGTVSILASHLESALQAAAEHPSRLLILDFAKVTYFGSAGLNAVLGCYEKGAAEAVTVRLVATNAEVIMPIEVTKLENVLKPYETVADALDGADESR